MKLTSYQFSLLHDNLRQIDFAIVSSTYATHLHTDIKILAALLGKAREQMNVIQEKINEDE